MRRRINVKDLPRRTMPFRRPFTATTTVQVFMYSREFRRRIKQQSELIVVYFEDFQKNIVITFNNTSTTTLR
jgi:hypothetical protein